MNKQINILLIEDNPGDARLIEEMLRESVKNNFFWHVANTLQKGSEKLCDEPVDVVLLDLGLPDSQGIETLKQIMKYAAFKPIIIMTGLDDEDVGIRAMAEGAQDYIVKGSIGPESLKRIIVYAIERKQNEKRLGLKNRILKRLNQFTDIKTSIRNILALIKETFEIDAIGMRLKKGDDYPYFETNGFSTGFIQTENSLCALEKTGYSVEDKTGNPHLECMCGNVICGRTDASLPFFTNYGSFWTNSTASLIVSLTEQDPKIKLRNRCKKEGYESVALIPLRTDHEIIGLLQINHKQPNLFTYDLIQFFEGLASNIGFALQHRQDQDKIEASETRFRDLIRNNADAIIVIDRTGIIRYANFAAQVLFDRPKTDLIGSLFGFPIIENDETTEIEISRNNHQTVFGEMRMGKINWLNEEVTFATIRDITERKVSEKEKEELKDRLQQAQKMESIGTLAGGIAHDFNNILSAIIGYSELAMDNEPGDESTKEDLKEILQAGHRARHLVNQILTFSRQTKNEQTPLSVYSIVNEALKLLRSSLPATIEIKQDLKTRGEILADPTQIHQIVMNLCTNAYHAIRPDSGVIEVSLSEETVCTGGHPPVAGMLPDHYIRLMVKDTGVGMDDETIKRIFDPYYTTKPKGEGTGLGLSVVHGVVESHKGFMKVESRPGDGTGFQIFFPKIRRMAGKNEPEEKNIPARGTEKILLVDDEKNINTINQKALERLGYHVESTLSSTEALSLFKKQPDQYDMIITDMTMPAMTGYELACHMLAIRPDVPIILCTGFSEAITEKQAMEAGIKAFLMKPILKQKLLETVRRILDEQN